MSRERPRVGTIEDVVGHKARVRLVTDEPTNLVFVDGTGYRIGQVGSLVQIPLGLVKLVGVVTEVGASAAPDEIVEEENLRSQWLSLELLGQVFGDSFSRGVTQHPTIGDPVELILEEDLSRLHDGTAGKNIQVGNLANSEGVPATLDLNSFVSRHGAIVGNTGSGKSTTVATILNEIASSEELESARVIVFDIHGEYGQAFEENSFAANPRHDYQENLYIPYWALHFDDLVRLLFGELRDNQRSILKEKVLELKREQLQSGVLDGVDESDLTVDLPVPFSIHQLWFDLHVEEFATYYKDPDKGQTRETMAFRLDEDGELVDEGDPLKVRPPKYRPLKDEAGDPEKIRKSKEKNHMGQEVDLLASKLRDPRLGFVFNPGPFTPDPDGGLEKDLDALLESWLGEGQVSVFDLSGVPADAVPLLVGSAVRLIYDTLLRAKDLPEGSRESPVLFVFEEAHRYLRGEQENLALNSVKGVVKEGRKQGLGALVVSQRPREVDPVILSQCGTMIAMRLTDSTDQQQVRGAAGTTQGRLFDLLPVLGDGEAIIHGEAANFPIRAQIDQPQPAVRPESRDPSVYRKRSRPGGWNWPSYGSDYEAVLERIRSKDVGMASTEPHPPGLEEIYVGGIVEKFRLDFDEERLFVSYRGGESYVFLDVGREVLEMMSEEANPEQIFLSRVRGEVPYRRC